MAESFVEKLRRKTEALKPKIASPEMSAERLDVCKACPEFFSLTEQCRKCGCLMGLKTRLLDASCPLGKW